MQIEGIEQCVPTLRAEDRLAWRQLCSDDGFILPPPPPLPKQAYNFLKTNIPRPGLMNNNREGGLHDTLPTQ